jgi:hypothetical protein
LFAHSKARRLIQAMRRTRQMATTAAFTLFSSYLGGQHQNSLGVNASCVDPADQINRRAFALAARSERQLSLLSEN